MIKFLNPSYVFKVSGKLLNIFKTILIPLVIIGLVFSLFLSPEDYIQGDSVRIMYIHVPAAWMSLAIYSFMAICSFFSLVWKIRLAYILSVAASHVGAIFAFLTLLTGSLWGKPIWGTWWVWDARLTSMLVLFLLYVSYIAIVSSSDNILRAEKPASVMLLIGAINVPIVKFSVNIWYSLHQPASVFRSGGPSIHSSMLLPLVIMFTSFVLYFVLILLVRTRTILNDQKSNRKRKFWLTS